MTGEEKDPQRDKKNGTGTLDQKVYGCDQSYPISFIRHFFYHF